MVKNNFKLMLVLVLALVYSLSVILLETYADPAGASITDNATVSGASSPTSRADAGGTITTMIINATQQNPAWKAYVGNISGSLKLSDSSGFSIYEWSLNVSVVTGEVYATRASSPEWSNITCANRTTVISTEQTNLSMASGDNDNINFTFSENIHDALEVAGTLIGPNNCSSIATYVNGTAQTYNSTSRPDFQELLLEDNTNLIYVSILEIDAYSYNNNISLNRTNDFQMIVGDDASSAYHTTYYFFAELDAT
jgi:hypothetical protein